MEQIKQKIEEFVKNHYGKTPFSEEYFKSELLELLKEAWIRSRMKQNESWSDFLTNIEQDGK